MITLRPYQIEATNAVLKYYSDGGVGNVLVGLPTGTGKSLVIGDIIRTVMAQWPSLRPLCLTHVKELVKQNAAKLLELWPTAPLGINSAALNRRDTYAPIIYGNVMSVKGHVDALGHRDFLIIDEAHLVSPDEKTTYRKIIQQLRVRNPKLKVIGFTATSFRLAQGMLTDDTVGKVLDAHSSLFQTIVYDLCNPAGFDLLIANDWLSPPSPKRTKNKLNVDGVKIQGGDFVLNQLQAAVDDPIVTKACLAEFITAAWDRKAWLFFCSGIEHSNNVAEYLNEWGFPAYSVTSANNAHRDMAVKAFQDGKVRGLANNNILTTGFDHPPIDAICMLRPTMSPTLWVQMLGRGTRPFEGEYAGHVWYRKRNCLVMDFAGNSVRLGPIDDPRIPNPKSKNGGDAPVKICENCGEYNHIRVRFCTDCGMEFEFKQKLTRKADTAELLSNPIAEVYVYDVSMVGCGKHTSKKTGNKMLKFTYSVHGTRERYLEFMNFEASGMALHKAHDWWRQRSAEPIPTTNDEVFIAFYAPGKLRKPLKIRVHTNTQFPEILGVAQWEE